LRSLRKLAAVAAALAALAGRAAADGVVPPPPDPAAVLTDELQRAVDAGTNAAIINFIARHPDEPMTAQARARLAARTSPDSAKGAGPDADIQAAFDAARLQGTSAALTAFARRYADHPLAAEALQPFWVRPGNSTAP
jgi:hypothetical protein